MKKSLLFLCMFSMLFIGRNINSMEQDLPIKSIPIESIPVELQRILLITTIDKELAEINAQNIEEKVQRILFGYLPAKTQFGENILGEQEVIDYINKVDRKYAKLKRRPLHVDAKFAKTLFPEYQEDDMKQFLTRLKETKPHYQDIVYRRNIRDFKNVAISDTRVNLSNSNITSLKGITKIIPHFRNIIYLDLDYNNIATLPPEIGSFTNLNVLSLRTNQLTTLPSEIGNLPHLKTLNLRSNQLTTLPPEIGNLINLEILNLRSNQLTTLPSEIGNLINLEILDLASNQLTTLPPEIGNLTHLRMLILNNNQFDDSLDVSLFTNLPQNIALDLAGNQISPQKQQEIKDALPNAQINF